jgi:uncharacterized protein YodC (DUF2158 family)
MSVTAEIGPLRLQSGHLLHIRCEDPKPPTPGEGVVFCDADDCSKTCESAKPDTPPEPDLKPGDQVRLKSGGPWMTLDSWSIQDSKWLCVWFKEDHECTHESAQYSAKFSPATLKKYS